MKIQITWKEEAQEEYREIVEYLYEEWGAKAANKFIDRVDWVVRHIVEFPEMYPSSAKKNIRKAFINKRISLYYRVYEEHIELLFFWNKRRNPDDLPL